ncbi:MAG: carboxymuconolactone decarboxylase family protein [Rhodospirillales bacterium]
MTVARLPYCEDHSFETVRGLVTRIRAARGGTVPNLFKMLLHSPNVAAGWFEFLSATRKETILDARTREFVILYVAKLLRAAYPQNDHVPIALKEGITQAEIDNLESWRDSELYSARDRALLAYVEESTLKVQIAAPVFEAIKHEYEAREIVEITVLLGAYHLVVRFLEALEIDLEPE